MSLKQKISCLWGPRKEKTAYWHKVSTSNPVASLGYIKCYSSIAPDILKALAILSNTAVRSLQLIEKTCNHAANQKKEHIFLGGQKAYYLQVFRRLY